MKIVGVSDDRPLVERCEKDVQDAFGDTVSAARSQPYYLDVTHPQANKGVVVETLSKMLAIPADEIATIGDMPNDVLMFRKSGFSIAMGNASDEVKQQASAVTDSYNDEGFAKAIENFLLGAASPRRRPAMTPLADRALDPVGRFRPACRGGPIGRSGGRGLDPRRRDGRTLRPQHHHGSRHRRRRCGGRPPSRSTFT